MRAQLRRDVQGRGNVETFPRARVHPMGDGVQLALRVARAVRALGHGLAQQPIRVLVGAAWPRAVGIGNEHPHRQPLGQACVLGHLVPAIVGQGFAQQRGHRPEVLRKALSGTPRIRPVPPGQNDQTGGSLHQGPDDRPSASPLDQVALPVAGHRPGRDFGRTLGDRRHIGDLAAAICPPCPRPTRLARRMQRHQPCAPPRAAGQHIQAHIEGLSRELFPHVVRTRG